MGVCALKSNLISQTNIDNSFQSRVCVCVGVPLPDSCPTSKEKKDRVCDWDAP